MTFTRTVSGSPVQSGKTVTVFPSESRQAGVYESTFSIDSDTFLLSVFAEAVSGSILVEAFTLTDSGKEVGILTFSSIIAPTPSLIIQRPTSLTLSNIKVRVTSTGTSTWELRCRGVSGSLGESSGSSPDDEDCNIIKDELIIYNTGELIVNNNACVSIENSSGGSRFAEIHPLSTLEFS